MKRRKVTYPVARTHTKGAPKPGAGPEAAMVRPNLVAIDLTAGLGRQNLKPSVDVSASSAPACTPARRRSSSD